MPHIKNIGVLQIEGPNGERNLARGTAIFLQDVNRPQFADAIAELDRIGGRSSFFQDRESLIDRIPGVKQISTFSHDKLWEYDTAQRLSLNEWLKRTAPALSDYERGARINEVLFDYAHRSPLAEMLADIGAPFPHWRLSNPGRQLRRAYENPAGVERLARAETDYNQDVTGKDAGYKMDFATPLDEGAKAVVDPLRYFGSTVGGPIRTALPYLSGQKTVTDLAGDLTSGSAEMDAARAFIPEVGMAESITGIAQKYPTRAPQIAAAIGAIWGAYPRNDEGARARRIDLLMKAGMDRYDATNYATYHR